MSSFTTPIAVWRALRRRKVFASIHAENGWGDPESMSGPGSTRERAESFLAELIRLVRSLEVETLLDAPCGDFNWAGPLADAVPFYVGVDVVPALIDANQRHAGPRRQFLCRDLVHEALPAADLVLCRDGLVHLSNAEVRAALGNLRRTGARWLVTTSFAGDHPNADIRAGNWRPLNLERAPFHFPPPLARIDEHCGYDAGKWRDKGLALWEFAALPEA
jgi:Methyltransferase domain